MAKTTGGRWTLIAHSRESKCLSEKGSIVLAGNICRAMKLDFILGRSGKILGGFGEGTRFWRRFWEGCLREKITFFAIRDVLEKFVLGSLAIAFKCDRIRFC